MPNCRIIHRSKDECTCTSVPLSWRVRAETLLKFFPKSGRADQTVSHGDFRLGRLVVLTPPTLSDWPHGGATVVKIAHNKEVKAGDFLTNLLLRSTASFFFFIFPRSEANQCREILRNLIVNNYQNKSSHFDSQSHQHVQSR